MTTDSVPAHNDREKLIEALFYEQDDGRHVFAFIDPRATLEDDPYLEEMLTQLSSLLATARADGLKEAAQIADAIDKQAEIDLGIEYDGHAAEVAAAIRAVSGQPGTAQEETE